MEESKKVLLVNLGPTRTGVGNYANLILNYGRLNYDVLNISLFGRGSADKYPKSKNGVTYFYGQKSDSIFKNYLINYFLLNKNNFYKYLETIQGNYNSIFLDQQDLALLADIFYLKFKGNIYITVHDVGYFNHAPVHPYRFYIIKNFKALKSVNIKSIMCDSNSTEKQLIEKYPEVSNKTQVVELSVDQNRYIIRDKNEARKKLHLPLDKILILNIGKDGYVKNVINFINSIKYIKNDSIVYVRVGKLTYSKKDFSNLPESLRKRILIIEDVSDDSLPLYYNACDIFVFPSLAEGFGLELVEAHLSGNIIITTDRPPMNDLIIPRATMLINNPLDPNEIAGLIDRASTQYNDMKKMLMEGYTAYKERFSIEKFIKKIEDTLSGDF